MQEDISIWDATNRAPIEKPIAWKIGANLNPSKIKETFELLCEELLGRDCLWGTDAPGMGIQVGRYQRGWLRWTQNISEADFVKNVFYRINHPLINISPWGWVSQFGRTTLQGAHSLQKSEMPFSQAEELRRQKVAEQQKQPEGDTGDGAGENADEPGGSLEEDGFEPGNKTGRTYCT